MKGGPGESIRHGMLPEELLETQEASAEKSKTYLRGEVYSWRDRDKIIHHDPRPSPETCKEDFSAQPYVKKIIASHETYLIEYPEHNEIRTRI